MKLSRTSIGLASLSLLALAGCPVTGGALCDNGTCEAAVDATATQPADAGPDGIVVAPRDECVDKPTAPECVTNDKAFFVSKAADPAVADGTIEKPYASITTALSKVTGEKKRVYVCEGTYEEQVTIETIPATLIGGIACDFRTPGAKAKIAPKSGIAFGIAAVGGASVIDVVIEAVSDPNAPGSSAVGMFITSSTEILLRGVEITAGAGQPGTDGSKGTDAPNHPGQLAPTGMTGSGAGAATIANSCTVCADGTFSKAGNGAGRTPAQNATSGDASPKALGQVLNGGGSGDTCGDGKPGAHGTAGVKAAGGTVPGTLAAKSWTDRTTSAAGGKSGGPGQGGGGGGALSMSGGGGGTGACGGCGGTGGGAGSDGGSSIGILAYQSTKVVLEKSTITTAAGGKGGNGGDGQKGEEAAAGGGFGGGGGACNGGAGGQGAGGGGGGGGVGGYSAAIAYLGEAPQTTQSILTSGAAGPSGTGGKGGAAGTAAGNKGEDGADGAPSKAEAMLNLAE